MKAVSRHRLARAAILSILAVAALAACGPAPLGTDWASLSVIGDEQNILIAFNDRLVMVDPETGKTLPLRNQEGEIRTDDQGKPRLWEIRQGPNIFFSAPIVIEDNRLLVATYNQTIYEVDLPTARIENGTGAPIPDNPGHLVADLLASDDTIYAGLSTKNLVALDRDGLTVKWTFPTRHGVWAQPLLIDGVLYFASLDHTLYAVDAETGEEIWTLDVGGAAPSAPAFADGVLYLGTFGRRILAISLDGAIVSEYETVDWVWGTPALADGMLYAADLVGNVYALDTRDGLREVWKVKAAAMAIRPTPLVTQDAVLVASRDQKLYWLNRDDGAPMMDAEGRPLVREMQSPIFSDILLIEPNDQTEIAEPLVVVSTLSPAQMLVAYSLEEGRFLWTYSLQ